jgi:hypothetical protein
MTHHELRAQTTKDRCSRPGFSSLGVRGSEQRAPRHQRVQRGVVALARRLDLEPAGTAVSPEGPAKAAVSSDGRRQTCRQRPSDPRRYSVSSSALGGSQTWA